VIPRDRERREVPLPISLEKVLIVEGRDEVEFIEALLHHLGVADQIEIRDFGGVTDMRPYLKTLVDTPGFDNVISLGVARDAETNAASAFQSVADSLRQYGLPAPRVPLATAEGRPRTSVFIFPDCHEPGMLETLCLRAVADDAALLCVVEYFACLERQGTERPTNDKARAQALLASRPKPGLLVGQAAHAGYWPWDSPALADLRQFLRRL